MFHLSTSYYHYHDGNQKCNSIWSIQFHSYTSLPSFVGEHWVFHPLIGDILSKQRTSLSPSWVVSAAQNQSTRELRIRRGAPHTTDPLLLDLTVMLCCKFQVADVTPEKFTGQYQSFLAQTSLAIISRRKMLRVRSITRRERLNIHAGYAIMNLCFNFTSRTGSLHY